MKGLYTFFALLVLASCYSISSYASSLDSDVIQHEVQASFQGLAAAFKRLDPQAYFAYFDQEKFSGLSEDGTTWTSFGEIKALIEPSFAAIDKVELLTFTKVHITVIDSNTVILVNEYEQRIRLKDGSGINGAGGGAQVWSKRTGKWQLVSVSASARSQ